MTIEELHCALVRETLGGQPLEDDGLALMLVLHTHHVALRTAALDDRPNVTELEPITQRHAAEVVAAAWPDQADRQRVDPAHWYVLFNTRTPYEVVEDLPPEWAQPVEKMRKRLAAHPAIRSVEPDD